jgi:hypothetical protein
MLNEPGKPCKTLVQGIDQLFESILLVSNVEIRIPNVVRPDGDGTSRMQNYGESTPQGLNVRRSDEIWGSIREIWREGTKISESE